MRNLFSTTLLVKFSCRITLFRIYNYETYKDVYKTIIPLLCVLAQNLISLLIEQIHLPQHKKWIIILLTDSVHIQTYIF